VICHQRLCVGGAGMPGNLASGRACTYMHHAWMDPNAGMQVVQYSTYLVCMQQLPRNESFGHRLAGSVRAHPVRGAPLTQSPGVHSPSVGCRPPAFFALVQVNHDLLPPSANQLQITRYRRCSLPAIASLSPSLQCVAATPLSYSRPAVDLGRVTQPNIPVHMSKRSDSITGRLSRPISS
jgi:hypothetical protein